MGRKRGYILILTLLVMGALILWGIFILNLYRQEQYTAQKGEMDLIAEEAARAGISDAIYYLKKDSSWADGFKDVKLQHSGATYSISFDKKLAQIPWSVNNYNSSEPIKGWRDRVVPPGTVFLVSIGKFGRSEKLIHAIITPGGSLLKDDFSGGDGNWTSVYNNQVRGESYKVEDGKYYIGPGEKNGIFGEHRTFTGKEYWDDYTIDVTLSAETHVTDRNNPEPGGFGIFFRSTNITDKDINSYVFQYEVDKKGQGNFIYRKIKKDNEFNNNKSIIMEVPDDSPPWLLSETHNIKIEVKGNRFVTYVDGEKVLDYQDSNNPFISGKIGFRVWYDSYAIYIENLTVTGGDGSIMVNSTSH